MSRDFQPRTSSGTPQHHKTFSQRLKPGANTTSSNQLNLHDSDLLLASFPNTRLSYETTIHKNDNPSFFTGKYKCFILPKGKRCIAWVTEWKRDKIVAVIDIANNYQGPLTPVIRKFHQENGWYPGPIRLYDACMDHSLVYGSVFGGVLFRSNTLTTFDKTFFSLHTVYWYKGNSVPSLSLFGHVQLCERIFNEAGIRQVAYTKQNSIMFGLPILCHNDNDKDIDGVIRDLPYPVFAVQYRFENHCRVCLRHYPFQEASDPSPPVIKSRQLMVPIPVPVSAPAPIHAPAPAPARTHSQSRMPYIQPPDEMLTNIQAVFLVRPNIQNDIYELFVRSTRSSGSTVLEFHNFTHISGYTSSVMMNRLFRNIVENQRLDAQEESEDETEFENTEPDKYVSLHKEYLILCRFNKRFCRWVPVQVLSSLIPVPTSSLSQVITDQQVKQHEMRYLKYHHRK